MNCGPFFPIYLALAKQLERRFPFRRTSGLCRRRNAALFAKVQQWLERWTNRSGAPVASSVEMTTLNASETAYAR